MNKVATVVREIEKDLFEVALGPIKMRVKRDELTEPLKPAESSISGKFDPLGSHPTDPRTKYRCYFPADFVPA